MISKVIIQTWYVTDNYHIEVPCRFKDIKLCRAG